MQTNPVNLTNTRISTEDELFFLMRVLTSLSTPKRRYLKAALNTAVFWIFSLAAFCIIWFIIGLVITAISDIDVGISSEYATIIFPIAVITAALFSLNSTRKWLKGSDLLYKKVNLDLSVKKTHSKAYNVVAAKCFQEPEYKGLIYLLLLKSSAEKSRKIRVIYDYESQKKRTQQQALITITTQLIINTAPQSQITLNYEYNQSPFNKIEHYPLTVAPEFWPQADTWLEADWHTLEQCYSFDTENKKD